MLELISKIFLNTWNQESGYLKQHYVEIKCKKLMCKLFCFNISLI